MGGIEASAPDRGGGMNASEKQPRLTDKNKALGTLLGEAMKNLAPSEKAVMGSTSRIWVDPRKTRLNHLHNRMGASLEGAAIADLVQSFAAVGQQEATEGWRLPRPDADGVEFVLIKGARRRAAAMALGKELLLEVVTEPSETELAVRMFAENDARREYEPLERAYEWQKMLKAGVFQHQTELAAKLGQEESKVSRIMSLLTMPAEVLAVFKDPANLPLVKGAKLAAMLQGSEAARTRALAAAAKWQEMDGQGSPLSLIFEAAEGRAKRSPPPAPRKLMREGKEVGRVVGLEHPHKDVRISLSRDCPPEARDAFVAALDAHFPDWRKTRAK